MRKRIAPIIVVSLLALAGGAYWYVNNYPRAWEPALVELGLITPEAEASAIRASGFIEVRQVEVAPEVSGRIARLLVDEGDAVQEGDLLAEIDAALLDADMAEAEAAVRLAQAHLARVEAGARAEEIELARSMVVQAETQRDAAYQAWQDALMLRDNPQELDLQIAATRSQLAVVERRIEQLAAVKDAAELVEDLGAQQVTIVEEGVDFSIKLPDGSKISRHFEMPEGTKREAWAGWNLAGTDLWKAWVNLNQAIAQQDALRQTLNGLLALRNDPQQAEIQAARQQAEYEQVAASVGSAVANLDKLQAGATQEQIARARTRVRQAQAALDVLRVQREKYTLRAPISGMVVQRTVHEGESALPGTVLLTLGNLDSVKLTIYVPEPDVGRVAFHQPVQVSVDSYPGETFTGEVIWISDQAEYTPKNIQTKEERVSTVVAVKVQIPNSEHKLKPGLPADALLLPAENEE
jgi:multidrug efflux pump subunit AcrA (membrane-fusion protein)